MSTTLHEPVPAFLTPAEIEEFRSRLCKEAERQFVDCGVAEVSMRTLSKALGCSATTAYRYFENKDEILSEVRAAIMNRVCAMLEDIGGRGLGGAEWAHEHTRSFIDFAFKEPNAYRLIYDFGMPDAFRYEALQKANERSIQVRTAYVRRLIAEGHLEGDEITLGYMYFSVLHGLLMLRATGRPPSTREEFDRTCQTALRLVTRGARSTTDLVLELGMEGDPALQQEWPARPPALAGNATSITGLPPRRRAKAKAANATVRRGTI